MTSLLGFNLELIWVFIFLDILLLSTNSTELLSEVMTLRWWKKGFYIFNIIFQKSSHFFSWILLWIKLIFVVLLRFLYFFILQEKRKNFKTKKIEWVQRFKVITWIDICNIWFIFQINIIFYVCWVNECNLCYILIYLNNFSWIDFVSIKNGEIIVVFCFEIKTSKRGWIFKNECENIFTCSWFQPFYSDLCIYF